MPNPADIKARLVALHESAATSERRVEEVADPRVPPGWTMWRLAANTTLMPALVPDAPSAVRLRYVLRVRATLAGECPACGAVVSLSIDPATTPAAWRVAPVTMAIAHDPACPAQFGEADRRWFDPRAIATSTSTTEEEGDHDGQRLDP